MSRGLPVTTGAATYGVVDVEDCALGHMLALEKGRPGECYHLVDQNLSLPDLVRRASAASGVPGRVLVLPDWLLAVNTAFTRVIERIIPLPDILSSDALRGMAKSLQLTVDAKKARAELGWQPRPLDDALREILADELVRRGRALPPQLEKSRPQLPA